MMDYSSNNEMPRDATILIVDDDPTQRLLMNESLSSMGYTCQEAGSGEAALQSIQSSVPDLVLLDLNMPGMNGLEVCREIRGNDAYENMPVVMVTGADDEESIIQSYDTGATAFINKPIHWTTFKYRVQYLLKSRWAMVQLRERERHLDSMERISSILTRASNKDDLLRSLTDEVLTIFDSDHAFIMPLPGHNEEFVHVTYESAQDPRLATQIEEYSLIAASLPRQPGRNRGLIELLSDTPSPILFNREHNGSR